LRAPSIIDTTNGSPSDFITSATVALSDAARTSRTRANAHALMAHAASRRRRTRLVMKF
jgi:hypothetical protein